MFSQRHCCTQKRGGAVAQMFRGFARQDSDIGARSCPENVFFALHSESEGCAYCVVQQSVKRKAGHRLEPGRNHTGVR